MWQKRFAWRVLFLIPGLLLLASAIPVLRDGLARDAVIPAPEMILDGSPVPKSVLLQTDKRLRQAHSADGEAAIVSIEAAILAGRSSQSQMPRIKAALTHSPTDARAWMLLSDAIAHTSPRQAATALQYAFILAPFDYFLAEPRAARAAHRWDSLDADTRAAALRQAALLWETPELRPAIVPLALTPGGAMLMDRALSRRRDELQSMRKWLQAKQTDE